MGFELSRESYKGSIRQITIGTGDSAITVGGDTSYPFYTFEGEMVNRPIIAMEIWDMEPEDWPEPALEPFKDVVSDPAKWAQKCISQYGAGLIVLQLKSIDPNDRDNSPENAAATVKKVLDAIDVPLVVWGCASPAKDEEVLKAVAEACQGSNLILGPVEDKNYKGIAAAAMGYNHALIASSPIDVNLAKQINILLETFGMPMDRVLVDPTTGGLGYGLEYSYSVMERLTMAAMMQNDDKLQFPMINNLGNEIWKCKEARQTFEQAPVLGDPERRGILMEAVGGIAYLLAGSNILIMRHPESIRLVHSYIDAMTDGTSLEETAAITKLLAGVELDLTQYAPEPDLRIEEEQKPAAKAAPAVKEEAKPEPAKAEDKTEAKTEAPAAKGHKALLKPPPNKPGRLLRTAAAAPAATPAAPAAPSPQEAEELEAMRALAAEKLKEEEKRKQAEAAALQKIRQEAEAEMKALAAKEKEREERLRREEEERALKAQRAKTQHHAEPVVKLGIAKATPAANQLDELEKIMERLNRMHHRV